MRSEGKRVLLLVEDEALIAMGTKATLEDYGYQVLIALNGQAAITAVAQTPGLDLILMDINLGPGIDGTEAAAIILKDHDLPVVFLSSHMEPEIVERTEKITSYGYVVKQSTSTVLDASIKMAFKLFKAKVSEKKKETDLRQSEEMMRFIIRHDPNALAVYDRDLRYIAASNRYLQDYNVHEADIIGRHHYDVFPEMPQKWREVHQRCLAGAVERNDDDFFERLDGSVTYNRWECRPWYQVNGEIGGLITYTEVTTARKQAELKLNQSLDLLTKLARLVPGVIYQYRLDPDGRSAFPYASPGMNDIYEVTPEEVRKDASVVFGRLHPEDHDRVAEAISESARTLNTFYCDFRVILPRQGLRWRWSQAHPERLPDGGTLWHGIIQDVTERKQREEDLRESEARYHAVFDESPDAVLLTVPNGDIIAVNSAACRLFGWTREEIIQGGRNLLVDPTDPQLAAALEERARTGTYHGVLTYNRKGGGTFPGEVSSVIFRDKDGNARTSMTIRDVTEIRQREKERSVLQEITLSVLAARNLREFLEQVHASISKVVFAENFFVALYNKATGLFEEAYNVDRYDDFFTPSGLEKSISKHVFRTGRPFLFSRSLFQDLIAQGEVEQVGVPSPSWMGVPLKTADQTVGVMVVQDYDRKDRYNRHDLDLFASIAAQVALAVEYVRAQEEVKRQLEEKNTLLKEVHHRIKNNIASIGGLIALQMKSISDPKPLAILQDAASRVNSMRILYDKLLISEDFKDVSVKSYTESLVAAVASLFPDQVRIKLETNIADFLLDPKRLFPLGIIINELLTNITKYAFVGRAGGSVRLDLTRQGNEATLIVRDDGVGLPEEFDLMESKGFGLALVKMLSEQLGGAFTIESGEGTCCTVAFEV